jgi:hypothetical protein
MTFLKKLGAILLEATKIVTGFGPLASALIPGTKDDKIIQVVSSDLVQIAGIVTQVEVFGQALSIAGADKLKAAAPAVAQIILQSSLLANHKIANAPLFQTGCTKIADGMADVLNALKDNVDTESKT